MTTLVQLSELIDAFQWTSATGPFENAAYVDRKTGRIWWLGGDCEDEDDPVPDDLEDGSLYLAVPDPAGLGLGRRLALRFAEEPGSGGLKPYVLVRGRLEALVVRALYYDLVELAEPDPASPDRGGIWSGGVFFPLAAG